MSDGPDPNSPLGRLLRIGAELEILFEALRQIHHGTEMGVIIEVVARDVNDYIDFALLDLKEDDAR